MSRRERGSRRVGTRPVGNVAPATRPGIRSPDDAPSSSLREQLERASVPARALLPLRLFFGLTFTYAGLDKLLDPSFFDPSGPASIAGQLAAFARVSPLAPLVKLTEPFATPIGLLIALAEIAIGLGALTGLAFRLSAVGGAALSFLFWLTASWTTHPYYYGADLPYAFGWAALALAGDGGLLVPRVVRQLGTRIAEELPWGARSWSPPGTRLSPSGARMIDQRIFDDEPSPARRLLLQAGVLGAVSVVAASLIVPLRILRPSTRTDTGSLGGDTGPTQAPGQTATAGATQRPGATQSPGGTPAASADPGATPFVAQGMTVASISSVDKQGALRIRVPANAPSSLPAGDPGIIVKLADGTYAAYDATCTHEGCKVGWDAQDGILLCPCHGAAFDPNNHGAVLGGPTNQPLFELPLVVDHQAGTITLRA